MIFLVIIPGIPAAMGNFLVPLMLGAKDVAFPRLNLTSWWFWLIGMVLFLVAILAGGLDTGWTFYTPYSTDPISGVHGVIPRHRRRVHSRLQLDLHRPQLHRHHPQAAPTGDGWFQMPLMLWALYSTAIIQVLATPVLGITLLLLAIERSFGIGIFSPVPQPWAGDPILYQHFFWVLLTPALRLPPYVMILPAGDGHYE